MMTEHCCCSRKHHRRQRTEDGGRQRQCLPPPIPPSDIRRRSSALQLNYCSRLAAALSYHHLLRRTPSHIPDTFKCHHPSPPLNTDDYCCHPLPPSHRFDCCVSLCPHCLAFVYRHCHWKKQPPSNAPAHHPVLHHTATHSQLHLTG